jgi:hypothetical protein
MVLGAFAFDKAVSISTYRDHHFCGAEEKYGVQYIQVKPVTKEKLALGG